MRVVPSRPWLLAGAGLAVVLGLVPGPGGPAGLLRGAVCLCLAAALVLLARRAVPVAARAAEPAQLRISARSALGAQAHVALVEADGRRFLVAFGTGFAAIHALRGEAP